MLMHNISNCIPFNDFRKFVSDGNSEIEIDETALNDTINAINEAIEEFHQSISYVRMDWNTPSVEYLVFCSTFNSTTVK